MLGAMADTEQPCNAAANTLTLTTEPQTQNHFWLCPKHLESRENNNPAWARGNENVRAPHGTRCSDRWRDPGVQD